ncbi:Uncharacterized protein OBRU01_07074 [Operophtera brumata]|uniref:Uncharacterized protein n=1 Tax=Operophtera brumata TaxID=104452 RepID=A0A0L7LJG7_OPEBR|nr:Uncharacterized protein OBRU01_07074 [Operophtera brumata]
MFYPPCPQYYPVAINEWSPVIPAQCTLYSLQPIPVIVNPPVLSTQTCPYPPIVAIPPVTVANEFPVSPLVSMPNEFSLQMSNEVSPNNDLPFMYSAMMPRIASYNGFSVPVSNVVALSGTPALNNFSPFGTQLSNEETPMPNELPSLASFGYGFSPIEMPDIFSPLSVQEPNKFRPICATVSNEISPLSGCSYESFPHEYILPVDKIFHEAEVHYEHYLINPLEFYLSLPKDMFPAPSMMTMNPNSIIDEFCKVPNVDDHSWILDLEFGVPKTPVTRRVATYNVKLNSVHCKNVPEAIHPGFENCDKELKRALMFYYDCLISNWYRGYISMSHDRSVENFQSWLGLPMQVLGMCWA